MNRTCHECGDRIVGREDKKFCGDGCRNSYNNRLNKDTNNFMRSVNNKLRRNYRILSELNPNEKAKASRQNLINRGFDFAFFTNVHQSPKGKTYYFLYDQGYLQISGGSYMIVKRNVR